MRLLDDNGNELHYANDAFTVSVEGSIKIIGPKTISLVGGAVGFWVKASQRRVRQDYLLNPNVLERQNTIFKLIKVQAERHIGW